jgi:hypothetical protein
LQTLYRGEYSKLALLCSTVLMRAILRTMSRWPTAYWLHVTSSLQVPSGWQQARSSPLSYRAQITTSICLC